MLGGSFDPVHIGHLFIAEEAKVNLGYERIVFVPAYQPPHKDNRPEAGDTARLAMLQLAVNGRDDFEIEPYEIDRRGVSYTIDTVGYLEQRLPVTGKLGLIIGDDLVDGFHTWKRADELSSRVEIIVATRELIDGRSQVRHGLLKGCQRIDNSPLPVSSSDIRERVRSKRAFRYLVPERVHDYISRKQLYTN
jgi:nicotinate-nucleotide adenylyltransferase